MIVSGQEPKEPVISPAGYVFEKSLIEKYLTQNENCPITGDPLSVEELIPIKSTCFFTTTKEKKNINKKDKKN